MSALTDDADPRGECASGTSCRRRVLVIDDEPEIRALLTDLLTAFFDVDVDAAGSGAAGLALFSNDRYDLVLTDLRMPDMGGWELIDMLRRGRPDTRVIMLTGSASPADAQRAREARITLVSKPASVPELNQIIEQALSVEPSPGTRSRPPDGNHEVTR